MSLVLHQSEKLSTGTTSPLSMWKPSLCSNQPSKIDQKTNKQTTKQKQTDAWRTSRLSSVPRFQVVEYEKIEGHKKLEFPDKGRLTSLWIGDSVLNRNSKDCLLLVSK